MGKGHGGAAAPPSHGYRPYRLANRPIKYGYNTVAEWFDVNVCMQTFYQRLINEQSYVDITLPANVISTIEQTLL